jgi:4-amino-4-deoxy-L-arabinose transferase-like glycosyltransferase
MNMSRLSSLPLKAANPVEDKAVANLVIRLLIVICLWFFFSYVGRHRLIDGDEGFYLHSSRLVMEQKLPYLDFFSTQAPLLPYAYGLWMKLFGINWYSARSFSAFLTTILGMLVYEHVYRETNKWLAGVAAVILFTSSGYIFTWFPIAKTYSLTGLLLFTVYMILARVTHTSSPRLIVLAGILFGLSVDTRLFAAGLAPLFIWWVFERSNCRNRLSRVICFLGGLSGGIAPFVYLFVASPDVVLFNILGFHAIRSDAGLVGNLSQKLSTIIHVFVYRDDKLIKLGDNAIQLFMLLFLSVFMTFPLQRARSSNILALLIAFALGFISLLPTPVFAQYFCMSVPYLIVASVCATADWMVSLRAVSARQIAVLAGLSALLVFVASGVPSFRSYLFSGHNVIGVESETDAPNWTLENASAVSEAIDRFAAPKEKIASFWPGYVFASHADSYPGLENDFGRMVSNKLTSDQIRKYHNITRSAIEADFAAHDVRIVVVGNQRNVDGESARSEYDKILRADGYIEAQNIGDTHIYALADLKK